jgi:hypothetical protein
MAVLNKRNAIAAIEKLGACLVFPLDNRPEPVSLWSHFFPRSRMRWEWDAGGDDRVPRLWHLRTELALSGKVVYAKWYQGRATFFSLPLFSALVRLLSGEEDLGLSEEARRLYQCFEEQSPLSTKEVKQASEMQGRDHERAFERGMKELWSKMLVVAFGEKDDGAFPSLLVGATKWIHGEAWRQGREMSREEAMAIVDRLLPEGSPFRKQLNKQLASASRTRGRAKPID